MTPAEFIDQLLPGARACQRTAGIPASFTIAQAACRRSRSSQERHRLDSRAPVGGVVACAASCSALGTSPLPSVGSGDGVSPRQR